MLDIASHLSNGVAHQHTLEVIAIAQSVGNTRSKGINVLQHSSVFNTYHIVGYFGLHIMAFHCFSHKACFFLVQTSNSEVRQTFESYLFGVARTCYNAYLCIRYVMYFVEILTYYKSAFRFNTFDSRKYIFIR